MAQTGGTVRPKADDSQKRDKWAREAYDYFCRDDRDVDQIAQNLAGYKNPDGTPEFSREDVLNAKNNVMREEHLLTDYDNGGYQLSKFDPSDDIAAAWIRMAEGNPHSSDIVLLRHEVAESDHFRNNPGSTYSQAHQYANSVSNWEEIENIPHDILDFRIFGD